MSVAEMRFVELFGSALAAQGFPRIPAAVLLTLMVSDDTRATSSELVQRLKISPAAVSSAVRYLSTLNFVRVTTLPGGRRHVYTLSTDPPWYTGTLADSGRFRTLAKLADDASAELTAGPAKQRVDEMADFFAFIERRMPTLLDEWLAERSGEPTRRTQRARPPSP